VFYLLKRRQNLYSSLNTSLATLSIVSFVTWVGSEKLFLSPVNSPSKSQSAVSDIAARSALNLSKPSSSPCFADETSKIRVRRRNDKNQTRDFAIADTFNLF